MESHHLIRFRRPESHLRAGATGPDPGDCTLHGRFVGAVPPLGELIRKITGALGRNCTAVDAGCNRRPSYSATSADVDLTGIAPVSLACEANILLLNDRPKLRAPLTRIELA